MTKSIHFSIIFMALIYFSPFAAAGQAVATPLPAQAYVLEKLRTHALVFMGTTHKQPAILSLVTGLLPRLRAGGVTHLALEIASDQQMDIDRFLGTRAGLAQLALHGAIDCPEYRQLLAVLAALPDDLRPGVRAVDLPPARYGDGVDRDQWMAERLLDIVQSRPDAKVLAVMGSLHVLRKLQWLPRIANGPLSIQARLRARQPDLSIFSIVNIVPRAEPHCDFGRLLGPLPGVTALDLDRRFAGWTLGLTRCIAIAPVEPYELVDGVIVY